MRERGASIVAAWRAPCTGNETEFACDSVYEPTRETGANLWPST
ncbi:hypothetical protein C7S13_8089 [Burkholderia cepacia]|nr:hypothetical protein [Burkholderia cepacia]